MAPKSERGVRNKKETPKEILKITQLTWVVSS